jgi:hypothetical protein
MHVRHRIAAATLLGLAALSGTFALSQTVHLGADAKKPAPVDAAAIAKRNAALDAAEKSARKALATKTPALPKVPKVGPVAIPNLGPIVVTRVASARRSPAKVAAKPRKPRKARVSPARPAAPAGTAKKRERTEDGRKQQREGSRDGGDD